MANNISNVWKLMGIDPTTGTGTYKNRMGLGNAITRDNGIPLDLSALHATYNDAVVYAATSSIAYVDQPIAAEGVLYLITEESQGKVKISSYRDSITGKLVSGEEKEYDVYLKRVGIVPTGDNASITVTAEGLVSLFGYGAAENGTLPVREDGKLVWKTLENIGAGDGNDNTTYEFAVCDHGTGLVITPLFNGQPVMEGEGEEAKQVKYHLDLDVYTKAKVDAAIKVVADKVGVPAEGDESTATLYERIAAEVLRATQAEESLGARIGVAKDGETPATGVYAYVDGVVNALVNGVDPEKIDSLNELIAWVEAHPDIVSGLDERLDTVEGILDGFGGEEEPATVKGYVDAELDAHELAADEKYATKQEVTNAGYAVATDVARDYATKQELTNHGTAADAKYATKDELAPVTQTANNAATKADNLETRINDIVATGGEPNAINTIKVNGTALAIDAQKAVDITVPTSITGMDGYSALNARVTENTNDIAALEGQFGTTNTNVSGLTTRLAALEAEVGVAEKSRIDVLEGALNGAGETEGLIAIVTGHGTKIGNLEAADTRIEKKADDNAAAILALQNKVDTGDKTVKTYVDESIAAIKPYDDTAIKALITAEEQRATGVENKLREDADKNTAAIALLNDKADVEGSVKHTVATELAKIISDDDADIDTLNEIAAWIINDTTGAAKMANDIAALNGKVDITGKVSEYVAGEIAKIPAQDLPAATKEVLGGVKLSDEVGANEAGQLEVKTLSTDKLVNGEMILVLNGGNATGNAHA